MGVKLEEIRFNILMSELDSDDIDYMSYQSFCKAIEHILRT